MGGTVWQGERPGIPDGCSKSRNTGQQDKAPKDAFTMLQIIQTTRIGNGNGPGVVNGRGLRHRKMTPQQGAKLATDAVLGLVQITPSIQQAATMVPNVRPEDIRAELRARTEATEL